MLLHVGGMRRPACQVANLRSRHSTSAFYRGHVSMLQTLGTSRGMQAMRFRTGPPHYTCAASKYCMQIHGHPWRAQEGCSGLKTLAMALGTTWPGQGACTQPGCGLTRAETLISELMLSSTIRSTWPKSSGPGSMPADKPPHWQSRGQCCSQPGTGTANVLSED